MTSPIIPSDFNALPQIAKEENNSEQGQEFIVINPFADTDYVVGLVCLAVSFGLFIVTAKWVDSSMSLFDSTYIFNYLIALFYFVYLMAVGKMKVFWKAQEKEFQPHRLLLWVIWIISCFALNRVISVFQESTPWLSVTVFLSAVMCIFYAWQEYFSRFLKNIFYLFLGISTVLWTYYAIYLSRLYPVSIPGLLVFGISMHSFIPLLLCITHIRIIYQKWNLFKVPVLTGIALPILFVLYFSFQWHSISYKIKYTTNDFITQTNEELPTWVMLGQTIGNDWITERLIKGNLIYQMPDTFQSFTLLNDNMGELSEHDPLVLIASFFSPKTDLSESERIKLLDVLFDARHYTQDRLWSGRNIKTENVITQAKIYPEYRLAYTEKTISIANNSTSQWSQGEALYTFYLPEGSVVSSLSLWINGKEEKGYLTTHTKAESAYKAIVGVESRDPSVIHWQEGNTVKIKVFPCTPKENRRFKIGITSPLKYENNKLVYENIYFQGPASNEAMESIRLDFGQNVKNVDIPFNTEKTVKKGFTARGKYRPLWEARFDAVPISTDGFNFHGKSYSVKPYQMVQETFNAKNIYFDINSSWSEDEFEELYQSLKSRALYIYDEEFVRLSDLNKNEIFEKLSANRYSLFPVHRITSTSNSLLITKGTATSPNLKDLQGSQFGDALKNGTPGQSALRTFNIDHALSPYFKTLNELRIVRCEKAEFSEIKKLVSNNQFSKDPEADTTNKQAIIRIDNAKLLIQESDQPITQNAPDHLLRFYAYNHIMQQIGGQYLSQDYLKASETHSQLIDEAAEANIVSPISSLIVLESQVDYKRFDIKKSKNSLDNATLKNAGAVPEPHEWVLIMLFALLATYFTFRSYVR